MAHKGRPGAWPSGQFELYDIVNNQIASAFNIGTVGLDFAVGGFADFNQDGTTDMQSSAVATSREGRRRLRSGSPTMAQASLISRHPRVIANLPSHCITSHIDAER